MLDIAAVALAFVLAFALKAAGWHLALAWLASCFVVPGVVLFEEHVLSGSPAMLPIAMFVGGIYGAAAGGVGALFAALLWNRSEQPDAGEPDQAGPDGQQR